MARKKTSYAQKHSDLLTTSDSPFMVFMKKNADIFETIRSPHEFDKKFLALPYPRQIATIELFSKIMRGDVIISPRNIKQRLLDLTYENLEHIHWLTGSYYEEGSRYFPIADDEKKLVRMECYGTIDARQEKELSPYYKFFCKAENRGKFRLKDYDLQASPMWRVFNQFESFRSIAPKVRRYIYQQGINPDALKVMTVSDFCDVIHKAFAETPNSVKAHFLPVSYKNKFVMNFMKACGKDFEQHLLNKNIDERKVKSLCRMMSKYGICDIDRLIIMETRYTPEILQNLQQKGYETANLKAGDIISEQMFDLVLENNDEKLMLARDENGEPLSKDDLPRFEVHHKNAVKFAHSGDYLAKVNYNNNLMLVEKEIHRAYYHGFDHFIQVNENNERYFSRVNSTVPEMCMINGFNTATDMFFFNLENNAAARSRAKTDKENVVNYYEMQYERLQNVPEIADKYGIEYSKTNLSNELKNLAQLFKIKVNISKSDAKIIEDWLSPEKSGKNTLILAGLHKDGNEK